MISHSGSIRLAPSASRARDQLAHPGRQMNDIEDIRRMRLFVLEIGSE